MSFAHDETPRPSADSPRLHEPSLPTAIASENGTIEGLHAVESRDRFTAPNHEGTIAPRIRAQSTTLSICAVPGHRRRCAGILKSGHYSERLGIFHEIAARGREKMHGASRNRTRPSKSDRAAGDAARPRHRALEAAVWATSRAGAGSYSGPYMATACRRMSFMMSAKCSSGLIRFWG